MGDPAEATVFVAAFVLFTPRCDDVANAGDAEACNGAVSDAAGGSLEEALAVAEGNPKVPLKMARHFGRFHSKS